MSIEIKVTSGLRFELFYALQLVTSDEPRVHVEWHSAARKMLGPGFLANIREVAPHPLFWPLLADVPFIDRPDAEFSVVARAFSELAPEQLSERLLKTIFRDEAVASQLASGRGTLEDAIAGAPPVVLGLLNHVGLSPFDAKGEALRALQFLIDRPLEFRGQVEEALRTFWVTVFRDEWTTLSVRLQGEAAKLRRKTVKIEPATAAKRLGLPLEFDDAGNVRATRGTFRAGSGELKEVWVLPSIFNAARLWTAQWQDGAAHVFVPIFDPGLELFADQDAPAESVDAPAILKALGDSTRYTIASVIARSPTTSVALAGMLSVSKPTISHHIRILREAGLLNEASAPEGVLLTLRREAVAALSEAALESLFSEREPEMVRSRRY